MSPRGTKAPALRQFEELWRNFRGLSTTALGSSVAAPFAVALIHLSPPWPRGILPLTALVEFLILVAVFQLLPKATRKRAGRLIVFGLLSLFAISTIYLLAFSRFTFEVPTKHETYVKGYVCTANAALVYGARCPDLGLDELQTAEYEAERLWTRDSIAVVRTGLVVLWLMAFALLSIVLGTFLVYQTRRSRA